MVSIRRLLSLEIYYCRHWRRDPYLSVNSMYHRSRQLKARYGPAFPRSIASLCSYFSLSGSLSLAWIFQVLVSWHHIQETIYTIKEGKPLQYGNPNCYFWILISRNCGKIKKFNSHFYLSHSIESKLKKYELN